MLGSWEAAQISRSKTLCGGGVGGRSFVLGKDESYLLLQRDISRRCEEVPRQFWRCLSFYFLSGVLLCWSSPLTNQLLTPLLKSTQ